MVLFSQLFLTKFHGQRSLRGYSPWGCKELDMTKQLSIHTHTHKHRVGEFFKYIMRATRGL